MALLIKLETDTWQLEIAGRERDLPPFIHLAAITTVELEGEARLSARVAGQLSSLVPGSKITPLFFENTDYDFYLKTTSSNVLLQLPPSATRRHQLDHVTHYALNFRNDVGWIELRVQSNAGDVELRFEVFPLKIDYRTDYIQMRDEVSTIAHNLAMTVQSRAFTYADPKRAVWPTLTEKLALIRYYFDELIKVGQAIARDPHSRLERSVRSTSLARARRVDTRALNQLLRGSVKRVGGMLPGTSIELPDRVPEVVKRVTFDTVENRYLKALLLEICHNLQRVIKARATGDEDADFSAEQKFFISIQPDAERMLKQLRKFLLTPFLRDVATVPPTPPSSLVLDRHPHYARFAKIARLLNGGLSLNGELLQIGVKDIALLYEYWCFLKLIELLCEKFNLEQQTLVKIQRLRATIVLRKGIESSVKFRDPQTGRVFYLVYNRLFRDLPTIAQRPDNVIQLSSDDTFYIFDAKYKLSFDRDYIQQYGGIGPTVEDVNTMHRYRDAIVLPIPGKSGQYTRGVVKAAIVLFPYPDEDVYRNHRFYQSISVIDIGGLPFLPTTFHLVETKLGEILDIADCNQASG